MGIGPVSRLLERSRPAPKKPEPARLVRLPSSVGMGPESWLAERLRSVRAVRLPSWVGMEPESWLDERLRSVRAVRLPSSVGMLPVKLLKSS